MTDIDFVSLHCHSSLGSMADSMASVDGLFKRAAELGQKAIAITDHGTLASLIDSYKASKKYNVKYIVGIEQYFVDDLSDPKAKRSHIVLLAKNQNGYKNLLKINHLGFVNNVYIPIMNKVFPRIDWNILKQNSNDLICLTACGAGLIAKELFKDDLVLDDDTRHNNILKLVLQLKEIFGNNLFLEAQTHALKKYKWNKKKENFEVDENGNKIVVVDQLMLNRKILNISKELDIPVVGTSDVHYLTKEDAEIHDMLMAINDKSPIADKNRHRYEVDEFYLKSGKEVFDFFANIFTAEIANEICKNTCKVSEMCEAPVYLEDNTTRFPKFNIQTEEDYLDFLKWQEKQNFENIQEIHSYMRYKCIQNFKKKFAHLTGEKRDEYKKRMIDELKVIEMHNFSSYMLIVSDFIEKAKKQAISIGYGRGSVGGSLVAYLLGIHSVDPIEYGLIFERFHNKEKKSFPDIDTDFAPSGREWVEKYIVEKYGKDNVAHVSNLSVMTPKVVIKDIARSLQLGGSKSEAFKISNAITNNISNDAKTFDAALKESEELVKFCAKYPEIEKFGRKLVGLEKVYSTHAAGIVISDVPLHEIAPLRYDKNGDVAVQYEKNRCESAGLIKMDLLGLEHLDTIDETIRNVKSLGIECKKPEELYPFDDKGVWNMISEGHTICVFQMSSPHMRALCKQIKPRNILDLSLVNALGRPSAVKSRNAYIARRDKRERVSYIHDCLKPALEETLGICVYEDQLMKVAKYVAGWDLNKADGLRKLTKLKEKGKELAAKLKKDFIEGAMEFNKLSESLATSIWENIVEPFEGYGFNKAHGIFYSINGYHTAYYKYHYPAAFMAAVLRAEVLKKAADKEKLSIYKKEAERLKIKIVSPNINKSGEYFTVLDNKTIVMGLAASKGVGGKAAQNIIKTRKSGEFRSFADFLLRTDSKTVKKNVIQSLAKSGAFDCLNITRKSAHDFYAEIRTKVNKYAEKQATFCNIKNILNDFVFEIDGFEKEWTKESILKGEMEVLGEYVSGNTADLYNGFFTDRGVLFNRAKKLADKTPIFIEAVVDSISESKTKTGKNIGSVYARCNLIDKNNENMQLTIWAEQWKKIKTRIVQGKPIKAACKVNLYKGTSTLVLERIENIGDL